MVYVVFGVDYNEILIDIRQWLQKAVAFLFYLWISIYKVHHVDDKPGEFYKRNGIVK